MPALEARPILAAGERAGVKMGWVCGVAGRREVVNPRLGCGSAKVDVVSLIRACPVFNTGRRSAEAPPTRTGSGNMKSVACMLAAVGASLGLGQWALGATTVTKTAGTGSISACRSRATRSGSG